ncbi:hypothetical protein [Actinocrispum sp. NPDC049592]|uniref:hypothetical protein n=1 Tax=Actinocrispum sp. NPDC049592 TaxID=3154835 RepID=UPI003434A0C4
MTDLTRDSDRTVSAEFLRDVIRGKHVSEADPQGLRLCGAVVCGRLDLAWINASTPIELWHCLLDSGVDAQHAKLPALILEDCELSHGDSPALDATGLVVGALSLRRSVLTGSTPQGAVRLIGARISGQLACTGARIRNDSGPAISADRLRVEGTVFLNEEFRAEGSGSSSTIRLSGADLSSLDCTAAIVRNNNGPALSAEYLRIARTLFLDGHFEAAGEHAVVLNLGGAAITGRLVIIPDRLVNTTNPTALVRLTDMTYASEPVRVSRDEWLGLLRHGTPEYAAQPYQHYAAALRSAGHDREARQVLMAQRRDQIDRALSGRAERLWARLTGLVLGYGYQPWRALIGLLAVVVLSAVLAVVLGGRGALTQVRGSGGCSVIDQVGVGLDVGSPLVSTGARARCDATNTGAGQVLTSLGWLFRLLAWGFATLFIAGFTGAVRKT